MEMIKSIVFFLLLSTLASQLISSTKYKPYVMFATGFMLISLLLNSIAGFLGKDISIETFYQEQMEETSDDFKDQASQQQKQQMETSIKQILDGQNIEVEQVSAEVDEDGNLLAVDLKAKEEQEKEIKRILLNFYNVEASNINISE